MTYIVERTLSLFLSDSDCALLDPFVLSFWCSANYNGFCYLYSLFFEFVWVSSLVLLEACTLDFSSSFIVLHAQAVGFFLLWTFGMLALELSVPMIACQVLDYSLKITINFSSQMTYYICYAIKS